MIRILKKLKIQNEEISRLLSKYEKEKIDKEEINRYPNKEDHEVMLLSIKRLYLLVSNYYLESAEINVPLAFYLYM